MIHDLKSLRQWLICTSDKIPRTANGDCCSVHDVARFMSYEEAVEAVATRQAGAWCGHPGAQPWYVGFVLLEENGLCCVDLDVKDASNCNDPELWTSAEDYARFRSIVDVLDSYTEVSASGKGLHIWVRATGKNARRDGVEVYFKERFIICTGDSIRNVPLADRQSVVTNMLAQMRRAEGEALEWVDREVQEDDWSVMERLVHAENEEKFTALWQGDWSGYPSQSEADLALMSMIAFHSGNNDQCKRVFRESGLGKREKATRDDVYLNRTLRIIRSRMLREERAREADLEAAQEQDDLVAEEVRKLQGVAPKLVRTDEVEFTPVSEVPRALPEVRIAEMEPVGKRLVPTFEQAMQDAAQGRAPINWPPGITGKVAQFIYESAPRPVKEVAIAAALGFCAGLVGKAWHIPQSGLNLYVTLIAKSGVGKEAMHSGIAALTRACLMKAPCVTKYIDFTEYVSGPALMKGVQDKPSSLNITGEWGRRLKGLAKDDGPSATLRTVMTNLYQKSGPSSMLGGLGYSDKERNVVITNGVSYSMIGETTPGTFYESLTPSMMEDGFLSRFLHIEYKGDRPDVNQNQKLQPAETLTDVLAMICNFAEKANMTNTSHLVTYTEEVASMILSFNRHCDTEINANDDEGIRQVWNRAALKAMRIAAVLAVMDNYLNAVVQRQHFDWAKGIVMRDVENMMEKYRGGEIGADDTSRRKMLVRAIKTLLRKPRKGYEQLASVGIVALRHVQYAVQDKPAFAKFPLGADVAVQRTVATLVDTGVLVLQDGREVKGMLDRGRASVGKCYQLVEWEEQ